MKCVIVDTGPFVAMLVRDDPALGWDAFEDASATSSLPGLGWW